MSRVLYWLDRDLRFDDNPALVATADAAELDIVYCLDPTQWRPQRYHLAQIGSARRIFLAQALRDFEARLKTMGQCLHLLMGDPAQELIGRVAQLKIDKIITSRRFGYDENAAIKRVQRAYPNLTIELIDTFTLYERHQLPFNIDCWPETYSKFRRVAEPYAFDAPLNAPQKLPRPIVSQQNADVYWQMLSRGISSDQHNPVVFGGESSAKEHLAAYFSSDAPGYYKTQRNNLQGWSNSSKLSFWLSQGSLSARRAAAEIKAYQDKHGASADAHWLLVELLWREYFQWAAVGLGSALFKPGGARNIAGAKCFYPERFQKWCKGNTPYPLVNACMQELMQTGYLSNRGRQIAASCLVNELQIDWRYGAAWFEQQLLDYDVAVNWGNWQYIAGVGCDPRGGRHFNLEKQTELYDANAAYRTRWAPYQTDTQLDSIGIDDWPLGA